MLELIISNANRHSSNSIKKLLRSQSVASLNILNTDYLLSFSGALFHFREYLQKRGSWDRAWGHSSRSPALHQERQRSKWNIINTSLKLTTINTIFIYSQRCNNFLKITCSFSKKLSLYKRIFKTIIINNHYSFHKALSRKVYFPFYTTKVFFFSPSADCYLSLSSTAEVHVQAVASVKTWGLEELEPQPTTEVGRCETYK